MAEGTFPERRGSHTPQLSMIASWTEPLLLSPGTRGYILPSRPLPGCLDWTFHGDRFRVITCMNKAYLVVLAMPVPVTTFLNVIWEALLSSTLTPCADSSKRWNLRLHIYFPLQVKEKEMQGSTGNVEFTPQGWRKNFNVTIIEMNKDGFKEVRYKPRSFGSIPLSYKSRWKGILMSFTNGNCIHIFYEFAILQCWYYCPNASNTSISRRVIMQGKYLSNSSVKKNPT